MSAFSGSRIRCSLSSVRGREMVFHRSQFFVLHNVYCVWATTDRIPATVRSPAAPGHDQPAVAAFSGGLRRAAGDKGLPCGFRIKSPFFVMDFSLFCKYLVANIIMCNYMFVSGISVNIIICIVMTPYRISAAITYIWILLWININSSSKSMI